MTSQHSYLDFHHLTNFIFCILKNGCNCFITFLIASYGARVRGSVSALEEIWVYSDWNSDRTVEKFIFFCRLDVDRPLQNSCHKKADDCWIPFGEEANFARMGNISKKIDIILNCVTNKTEQIFRKHTYIHQKSTLWNARAKLLSVFQLVIFGLTPGLSGFWDQSQANSALYSAFWSVENTDSKM